MPQIRDAASVLPSSSAKYVRWMLPGVGTRRYAPGLVTIRKIARTSRNPVSAPIAPCFRAAAR